MSYVSGKKAMNAYGNSSARAEAEFASPHRLVQIMMDTLLGKLATARGHMLRKEFGPKGEGIGMAITILSALKGSLDMNTGGEIAANLDDLYGYMVTRLAEANVKNNPDILDEVSSLVMQIKSAWDAMPEEVKSMPRKQAPNAQAAYAGR